MCCDKRYIYTSDLVAQTDYDSPTAIVNDITPYASGDFIHTNAIQVSCATSETNGYGEVYGIHIKEVDSTTVQKKDLRIWIFNEVPTTTITANAARSWSSADVEKLAGYIDIAAADYLATGGTINAFVAKDLRNGTAMGGQIVPIHPVASSSTIYIAIEARAAVTYLNAAALAFKLLLKRM